MDGPQFDAQQRSQAIELLERIAWGDMGSAISGLEVALALSLEATGNAVRLWEDEGELRFGDEFELSADEVAELDDEWRLAYIARLLHSASHAYGVSPDVPPGRTADGEVVTAAASDSPETSPAGLLRGLNDILHGISPHASDRS